MNHNQQQYITTLVDKCPLPLHLTGPSGTGKSTMVQRTAHQLGRPFSFIMCTRQTSVSHIIGFMSVNGTYIPTPFRKAYEQGHIFCLEEMNAADPNVLIIFNSLEQGMIAFPDGYTEQPHPDFRLVATSNPNTAQYGARADLDFSTASRFYTIHIEQDANLALSLTSQYVLDQIQLLNEFLREYGATRELTMRDSILLHSLIELDLDKQPLLRLLDNESIDLKQAFIEHLSTLSHKLAKLEQERKAKEEYIAKSQHDFDTIEEVIQKVQDEYNG